MPDANSLIKRLEATLDRLTLRSVFRSKPPVYSPQGQPYATFNRRMLAATLDAFVLTLLMTPFNMPIMRFAYSFVQVDPVLAQAAIDAAATPQQAQQALLQLQFQGGLLTSLFVLVAIQAIVLMIYSVAFWHFYSSTPGKLLLGMRIVSEQKGERLALHQSIFRALAYLVSGIPAMLGFFAIAWHPRKQGWHDRLCGTVVVVDRPMLKAKSTSSVAHPSGSRAPEESE